METNEVIRLEDVDITSTTPIYQQIVNRISFLIQSGRLKPGDSLPTEVALCAKLGISRGTVRKAYADLVEHEHVIRLPQRGTFVAESKVHRRLDTLYGFSEEMRQMGLVPSSKVLLFKRCVPTQETGREMMLASGEEVFKLRRVRLGSGNPLFLETMCVPCRLCPDLTRSDCESSVYDAVERSTGFPAAEAHETYEPIALSPHDAKILGCEGGSLAFSIIRVTKNSNGDIFERSHFIAPSGRVRYEQTLRSDGSAERHFTS